MKIVYLGLVKNPHPWYRDFVEANQGRHLVHFYDPDQPTAEQFEGASVVVDAAGLVGDRDLIDAASTAGVRLWQIQAVGTDNVDFPYFAQKGIPVAKMPGSTSGNGLAEHALFLMFCVTKNLHDTDRCVRSGVFAEYVNDELEGKTLTIIGLGASGSKLARKATGLDMRVMAVDIIEVPGERLKELGVDFFGGPADLDRVLKEADYLSLHTPLTSQTRHLIDARALGLMKPTAILINVARGGLVDQEALTDVLKSGRLRGAGLDVFETEPVDPKHPLLHMDQVVATSHIAGGTTGTSRRRATEALENIDRIAEGHPPLNLVSGADPV